MNSRSKVLCLLFLFEMYTLERTNSASFAPVFSWIVTALLMFFGDFWAQGGNPDKKPPFFCAFLGQESNFGRIRLHFGVPFGGRFGSVSEAFLRLFLCRSRDGSRTSL